MRTFIQWNNVQPQEEGRLGLCYSVDGPGQHMTSEISQLLKDGCYTIPRL